MYNILGQRVKTLVREEQPAGYVVMEWNGTNDRGAPLASGIYLLRVSAERTNGKKFTDVRKLMLLK
jgi:flagellar hook assembly protein FlgD